MRWIDRGLPEVKIIYAEDWAVDAVDRLLTGDIRGAKTSLSYADMCILNSPPGSSYGDLEDFLCKVRVKLYQTLNKIHQMKIVSETEETSVITKPSAPKKETTTFSTVLSDGREIIIREMTGRDLLYMEKDLSKAGDVEKGMKIIERLSVGINKISYEQVLDLGVRDFRKISDLVGKAAGTDEDEDPN